MSNVSMIDGHIDREERKLTDKEIIKALECIQPRILTKKERMALDNALDLINRLKGDVIHYRRKAQNQKQELKRLNDKVNYLKQEELGNYRHNLQTLTISNMQLHKDLKFAKTINALQMEELRNTQAEIEGLKNHNKEVTENCLIVMNRAEEHYNTLYEEAKEILIKEAKAEAIKEFADLVDKDINEKLSDSIKEQNPHLYLIHQIVKDRLKEMVGEDK